MPQFHDENDSLDQLLRDARDSDNPHHGTPHSVQESAIAELRRRGFDDHQVTNARLYGKLNRDNA